MAEPQRAQPENQLLPIYRHYACPLAAINQEGAVPEQPKADAAEEHVEELKETTEAESRNRENEPEATEKATEITENPQRLRILLIQPMLPKTRVLQFRMQQQRRAAKM